MFKFQLNGYSRIGMSHVTMNPSIKLREAYKLAREKLNGRLIAPYQREGVLWLLDREVNATVRKGGFLCDEMGLGKTVQIIASILGNPGHKTLIIVPKSVINQWISEFARFAPELKVLNHSGSGRTSDSHDFDRYDVVVTSYNLLIERNQPHGVPTVLHNTIWGRIVLDEGHEIRNSKSKVSVNVRNLKGEIRWVVTGTPVFNRMGDFVTLCDFVGVHKHVVQREASSIRKKYVLRRTKDDVTKFNPRLKLPPCNIQNIELDLPSDELTLYETVYRECQERISNFKGIPLPKKSTDDDDDDDDEPPPTSVMTNGFEMLIFECILRCRQVLVHPSLYFKGVSGNEYVTRGEWAGTTLKMQTLLNMLSEHPNEQALVFCQFTDEMSMINQYCGTLNRPIFRLDGSVPSSERAVIIKEFSDTDGGIFIIQIKAGGVGLNLQTATRVYITTPAWNPAVELQAIGRAHRTGQTKRVIVKKLYYKDTAAFPSVECSIMHLQNTKSVICSEVLCDERIKTQLPTPVTNSAVISRKIFHV